MIDSHFHIDFFEESERKPLLQKALAQGVSGGVVAGVWISHAHNLFQWAHRIESNHSTVTHVPSILFAKKHQKTPLKSNTFTLFATIGLHPWHQAEHWLNSNGSLNTKKMDTDFAQFEALLTTHKNLIWAIGETGFDLYKTPAIQKQLMQQMQRTAFEFCIAMAVQNNLPLIVHSRNAWQATMDVLNTKRQNTAVLMHCYSGSAESLANFHNQKMYASFGGPVTWQNAHKLKETVRRCPAQAILLETDAPDLPPTLGNFRPPRNEPHMLCEIAQTISNIRNCTQEELAKQCDTNLLRWIQNS